jgi:hypothetical protein
LKGQTNSLRCCLRCAQLLQNTIIPLQGNRFCIKKHILVISDYEIILI